MPRVVAFRVDASLDIGSGHVMRCLTLAEALQARGDACHFLCRDLPGNLSMLIRARGHMMHVLSSGANTAHTPSESDTLAHADWLGVSWEEDARQTASLLADLRPDWVVVDHYALDARWQQTALPAGAQLLVIDDLADRPHRADILLDQNLGRRASDYDGLLPDHCTRLIGPRYALLRPEFQQLRQQSLQRRRQPRLGHILITMGGVDKGNVTGRVLDALATCGLPDSLRITVVMGSRAPSLAQVQRMAARMPIPTQVKVNIDNMAEVMASADLAIGAAGSTSWERCCLGLPTLMLVLADNQIEAAQALERAGAAILLGDAGKSGWEEQVPKGLSILEESRNLSELSSDAASVCNGKGCAQVAETMIDQSFSLRKATLEDARRVWEWRYANGAARYYRSKTVPPYENHKKWFLSALNDTSKMLLIVCQNTTPVAHLRADFLNSDPPSISASIYVSPSAHGKGIGKVVLSLLDDLTADLGRNRITADVHRENIQSLKLFTSMGYTKIADEGDFVLLKKEVKIL